MADPIWQIRPEITTAVLRYREALGAGLVVLVGLWLMSLGGYVLVPLGAIVAAIGAILTLTAVGGGVGFLLAYILGLAVPFFVVALFADRIKGWLRRAGRISHYVEVLAGVVLVLVGVLLFTGTFTALNTFFLRITPEWLQRYL